MEVLWRLWPSADRLQRHAQGPAPAQRRFHHPGPRHTALERVHFRGPVAKTAAILREAAQVVQAAQPCTWPPRLLTEGAGPRTCDAVQYAGRPVLRRRAGAGDLGCVARVR